MIGNFLCKRLITYNHVTNSTFHNPIYHVSYVLWCLHIIDVTRIFKQLRNFCYQLTEAEERTYASVI